MKSSRILTREERSLGVLSPLPLLAKEEWVEPLKAEEKSMLLEFKEVVGEDERYVSRRVWLVV